MDKSAPFYEELKYFEHQLKLIALMLYEHSWGNSYEPSSVKQSRIKYAFSLLAEIRSHISEEAFESLIYTNTENILYNKSYDNLSKIKDVENYYLCTDLTNGYCNRTLPYKYLNKVRLKENQYGLRVNTIINLFTKAEQYKIVKVFNPCVTKDNCKIVWFNEDEIIVWLRDVDICNVEKYNF